MEVARVLYLDEETVRVHQDLYRTEGRLGVARLAYSGGQPLLISEELAELKAHMHEQLEVAPVGWAENRAELALIFLCG